jgi:hypothetical protein
MHAIGGGHKGKVINKLSIFVLFHELLDFLFILVINSIDATGHHSHRIVVLGLHAFPQQYRKVVDVVVQQ